ncbi:VOC family protein [Arenibacter sp. GZD96]|uniref:VOC family protein n=1 Tax=Aurantibrevibacter litoralis TaxID=3106030 RepID=UPI002AFF6EFB|nr:VOC family protein [Arenibacter sp. GZD-96]MEA1787493.1 VOC family protein [Arenibacter sp. GZD-96]
MHKSTSFLSLFVSIYLFFTALNAFSQTAKRVSEITVTVSNIDKIQHFYTQVLPFKVVDTFSMDAKTSALLYSLPRKQARVKMLRLGLGEQTFILQEFPNVVQQNPIPADSKSNDLWFQHIAIVVSDMEKAYSRLRENRVPHVSTAPQTLPDYIPAAAGIKAFYFRDPDGHNVELIYFPPGKGNPKWQEVQTNLFLGIDHTAIGISDTPKQQRFYESLGLKLAGKSENYGSEQEHLNQVFGARLEISGLVAQQGMGIEFLEYVAPPGGRKYPNNSTATDLWHWHSSIEVADLDSLYQQLKNQDIEIISKEIVHLKGSKFNASRGLMIRDVDGHAILLFEK